MWTNEQGQVFIIPRHRRKRILKSLWNSGFRDLVEEFYQGSWGRAIERALARIFRTSGKRGSICHSDGRQFPLFRSYSGETTYSFVAVPLSRNRFSVVSIRAIEVPEADRFDSRYTGRNLDLKDQHLLNTIADEAARENWRKFILDNQGQSDPLGVRVKSKGAKRATPVDRAYLTRGPGGKLERVNIELDGDHKQFAKHFKERTKADPKARSYFILQNHLTGEFLGAVHWNPRLNGGKGGREVIPIHKLFANGQNRVSFLPPVATRKGAVKDPGYRRPDTGTAGITRRNFNQNVNKILAGRKISTTNRRRSRESEWFETEHESEILATVDQTLT